MKIAALYVAPFGPYVNRDDIDAWTEDRDARLYRGTLPIVAHPPCQRWGRYWSGGPSARVRQTLGADAGCFAAALQAVLANGGVLEHPEASHAFAAFGLTRPPKTGGWVASSTVFGQHGWTCCVEQGHYGHPARKATWLFRTGAKPRELIWGPSKGVRLDEGFHSKAERDAARARGQRPVKRLSTRENLVTPKAFADLLITLALESQS